jgi:hypothetical protein
MPASRRTENLVKDKTGSKGLLGLQEGQQLAEHKGLGPS